MGDKDEINLSEQFERGYGFVHKSTLLMEEKWTEKNELLAWPGWPESKTAH